MKLILAYICYYLGDLVSKLLYFDIFGFMYPVYSRLMGWSVDLDINNRIWKEVE